MCRSSQKLVDGYGEALAALHAQMARRDDFYLRCLNQRQCDGFQLTSLGVWAWNTYKQAAVLNIGVFLTVDADMRARLPALGFQNFNHNTECCCPWCYVKTKVCCSRRVTLADCPPQSMTRVLLGATPPRRTAASHEQDCKDLESFPDGKDGSVNRAQAVRQRGVQRRSAITQFSGFSPECATPEPEHGVIGRLETLFRRFSATLQSSVPDFWRQARDGARRIRYGYDVRIHDFANFQGWSRAK